MRELMYLSHLCKVRQRNVIESWGHECGDCGESCDVMLD